MKTFYVLLCCLYAISSYGQTGQPSTIADGIYTFQKGTFIIYNYGTRSQIDSYTIDDPLLVNKTDVYFQNVFLEAIINNGVLSSCVLPDNKDYIINNTIELLPSKEYDKEGNGDVNNTALQLAPYSLSTKGNILTFTVRYLYGDSRYSFPLEGKLVVDLIKQK